jgi:ABC-2 type transport system ATP-binding protein
MNAVRVTGVSKAFRIPSVRRQTVREHLFGLLRPPTYHRLQVLEGVSFELKRGETLGIMGRNGSGKSTLLKVVCGIYPPDAGQVDATADITPILELGVGWNPELDAVDNVFLIGSVMGLTLAEIRQSLDGILAFAELDRFANLRLKHYSSGMSARLAYAVAFQAVREVLVLDEIFAVGDAGFRARCEARFLELRARGHTVLLVSHDPRVIGSFCDRALLLDGGRIASEGLARDVADRYVDLFAQELSSAPANSGARASDPGPAR